ncbi:MAG: glycosyltransferase [Bacteroidales bacterium]
MTQDPIISVLIITYNQEKYIAQAIESALNQNIEQPYEIVIGEDCSTDSTRDICQSYVDKYPSIVRLMPKAPNKGLLNNYYDTLLSCRGEFIADCAGDDYWCDTNKLQRQLEILRREPNVVMVHSNWIELDIESGQLIKDARGSKGGSKKTIHRRGSVVEDLLTQLVCPTVFLCSALFRKAPLMEFYYENIELFRDSSIKCEDLQLIYALQTKGDLYYEDEETVHYRIYKSSVSNPENPQKQFDFSFSMLLLRLKISSKFNIFTKTIVSHYRYLYKILLLHSIRSGNYSNINQLRSIRDSYEFDWGGITILIEKLLSVRVVFKSLSYLISKIRGLKNLIS